MGTQNGAGDHSPAPPRICQFYQRKREHNDANVVAVGARQHTEEEALALIDAFLETPFSGDERHQRRIDLMKDYERSVRA